VSSLPVVVHRDSQCALRAGLRNWAVGGAAAKLAHGSVKVDQPFLGQQLGGTESKAHLVGAAVDIEDGVAGGQ